MKRETPPFNPNGEYAALNKPLVHNGSPGKLDGDTWVPETQEQREARCHAECEAYYAELPMTEQERVWLHRGIEAGAKWIEEGDRIKI
jgi:hypothetical protein